MRIVGCLLALALLACGQRPAPATAGTDAQATSSPAAMPPTAAAPATLAPASAEPTTSARGAPVAAAPTPVPPVSTAQAGQWTRAPIARAHAGAPAILTGVSVTAEAGFDRVAFDFQPRLPGYSIELARGPVQACGSGDPVELPGTAVLVVAFRGAAAHDQAGRVTVTDRDRRPDLPALVALKLFCDFEGDVSWALALPRAARFRVSESAAPARLTVEIEHPH